MKIITTLTILLFAAMSWSALASEPNVAQLMAENGTIIKVEFVKTGGTGTSGSSYVPYYAENIQIRVLVPSEKTCPMTAQAKLLARTKDGVLIDQVLSLSPLSGCQFSGTAFYPLLIATWDHGQQNVEQQKLEISLSREGKDFLLIDPINGTSRFQLDLSQVR